MKDHGPARTYLTVNDALPDLAQHVLNGEELGSRKGERVLERLHQQITLTEPWDRYPRLRLRKASLPAQIAESMWILAGRNDVEWLSYYLPRAAEFSDDGETWRGGYGPRLRRFAGTGEDIDQLAHVVDVLRADPTSRRAVFSIYDADVDTKPGKDIPCNDIITFQSRLGELHAHVFVRSNDLMWGWSGINAFEWSVLQEVIAGILGIEVGTLTFSISSLHAYDRHWSKLRRISEAYPEPDLTMFDGFDAPRLTRDALRPRTVGDLDRELESWFEQEAAIRAARSFDEAWSAANSGATSALFTSFLQVIAAARFQCPDVLDSRVLRQSLKASPQAPFAVDEEVETIRSGYGQTPGVVRKKTTLTPAAPDDRPENPLTAADTVEGLADAITSLHDVKHAAYGDSWKRRGETLGILANVARKVDRLGKTDEHETALDTAVDLLVYLVKYEAWLHDQEADIDRSAGTAWANGLISHLLHELKSDRPYPAEFLAGDINASALAESWTHFDTVDKIKNIRTLSRRAARHVLAVWRAPQ